MSLEQTIADVVAREVRAALTTVQPTPALPREALTVREVAEVCGRSLSWAYDQIAHHGLPAKRTGGNGEMLVSVHALRRWLDQADAEPTVRAVA